MTARPGGELAIFHHLVERGAYQPEFVGRRGALLERLIVRGGSGSALRVGHAFNSEIFSMLGPRPWDGECVQLPRWAFRRSLQPAELVKVAAAVVDVEREWLERAAGASQTLAFCRRYRHHDGPLLRTDMNLDGEPVQDIAQEALEFLEDEDDSQFEPEPRA